MGRNGRQGRRLQPVVLINLIQLPVLAVCAGILLMRGRAEPGQPYLLLLAVAMCISVVTIVLMSRAAKRSGERDSLREALQNTEQLNHTLRAQRHDFLNHLQVVFGLIELEEYVEAHDYIERVYTDIQKVGSVLKTAHPAVNAILQAKVNMCGQRGIEMEVRVTTNLEQMRLPSWEFCRVLGNLIDNGIYALEHSEMENKHMVVSLSEELKGYGFCVSDNGPAIAPDVLPHLFEAGFSTKGEAGQGMGLAICREIMVACHGWLEVHSGPEETKFTGFIPRR